MGSVTWGAKPTFSHDFTKQGTKTDVDRTIWQSPHWQPNNNPAWIGRCGIRNPHDFVQWPSYGTVPVNSNGANLRFSLYNPAALGNPPYQPGYLGSAINTIQDFGDNNTPVKIDSWVLSPSNIPHGLVTSFFMYTAVPSSNQDRYEIDFEFVSNYSSNIASHNVSSDPQQINLNLYNNSNNAPGWHQKLNPTIDMATLQKFTIINQPSSVGNQIIWQINDKTIFTQPVGLDSALHIYYNFWSPAANGWTWAYNSNLPAPVSSSSGSTWNYYVQKCKVYEGTYSADS